MLQEFLTLNIFGFFLIFVRVGTAFMLMPGFANGEIPPQVKLTVALAISFVLAPVLVGRLPALPASPGALTLIVLAEAFIGGFFGSLTRLLASALHVAGTIISFVASLTNAFIHDPIADQQSSTVSGFLGTVGMVLVFVTDMHHLMLRAVVDSYSLMPAGGELVVGDFSELMARHVADAFMLGVQLSAPFMVVGLAYYVGLGILSRLMPALPVFFIGLPIQIWIQLLVLMLGLSAMMLVFVGRFEATLVPYLE